MQKPGSKNSRKNNEAGIYVLPAPKIAVSAIDPAPNRIKISFTRSRKASGYEVWRREGSKGKYRKIKTIKSKSGSFINTGLKTDKRYHYKVRAYRGLFRRKYGKFSRAASDIAGGNSSKYDINKVKTVSSKLKGRRILFLGSSVTKGYSTGNVSFVDYLKKKHGIKVVAKEAVNGTTISYVKPKNNYCSRLEKYGQSSKVQLLICQLSTNDARLKMKNAEVESPGSAVDEPGQGADKRNFTDAEVLKDLKSRASSPPYSVEDGVKYIIAYSNIKLGCPVMYFVSPRFKTTSTFNNRFYDDMRLELIDISKNWSNKNEYGRRFSVSVMDLWSDRSFSSFGVHNDARRFYMKDAVHPTKAGYYRKYMPAFERFLNNEAVWK